MGTIVQLQNKVTGENQYPRTYTTAVIDENATPLSTLMEQQDDKITELATQVIYDVSANNDGATFPSLSALLSSENLSTLIPIAVRCGGMNIRFAQTSDNKYVQCRLMANEWSTDTDDWAIAEEGVYVESLEFVYVKTDSEGKILWAIKTDGDIYYGAGVPQQVVDYINKRIAELSLDEYDTLKVMIDSINERIPEIIESPEFLEVTTDSEDKVLEGIQEDGTKVIGGDLNVGGSAKILGNMEVSGVSYKVIENPEYLAAWLDAEDKVIFGLKADGKTYVGDADFLNDIDNIKAFLQNITDKNIDWDALSSITAVENPEYIEAKTDSEGKLLAGRTNDGAAFENVGFTTPKVSIDGVTIKNIEDTEGRTEILTDAEGRIISYRDSDGVKHEECGIETDFIALSQSGQKKLQEDLKKNGLLLMKNDFSNAEFVYLPKPKFAYINLICTQLPTSKDVEYEGYFEYYDTFGNYFKKPIGALSVQGRSSVQFPKKNYGFDFADGSKIKFGDWVEQDSFHLKANYIDCFRGARFMIGYHMTTQIMNTYSFDKARPWRYLFANKTTINNATGKIDDDLSDEALGVPDGFPFKLYHNGNYIGLYTLQLKKHRDNYQMGKSKAKNIHIDGENYNNSLFRGSANIIWSDFEVRNPKSLKDINGNKYDGDNPTELSDTDALSSEVKGYIKEFSDKASAIVTTADFEEIIDADYAIDYVLLMNFLMNVDVICNNTQWCTWDANKWFPMNYDNDQLFGLYWEGYKIRDDTNQKPDDCLIGVTLQTGTPLSLLYTLYKSRMDARYKELVDLGIFTIENVLKQLKEWCNNIGKNNYEEEFNFWTETPSYRDGEQTYTNYPQEGGFYDSIERVKKYMFVRKQFLDNYFNYSNI